MSDTETQTPSAPSQENGVSGEVEPTNEVSTGAAVVSDATQLPGAILFIHFTDKANPNTKYSGIAYDSDITPGTKGSDIIKRWNSAPPYYELFTAPKPGQDMTAKFGQGTGQYYVGMYGTKQGPSSSDWPFKNGFSPIKKGFYMAFWNDTMKASGLFTNTQDAQFGGANVPIMKLQQGLPTKNMISPANPQLQGLFVACYAMTSGTLDLAN